MMNGENKSNFKACHKFESKECVPLTSTDSSSTTLNCEIKQEKRGLFEADDVIEHYLESIMLQNVGLSLVRNHRTIMREDHKLMTDKVKILTGGATKLEPLLSGFIGPGMLTAAVFGELASGPPYYSVLTALRILSKQHDEGILVIVLNNMADRLAFGLACQQAAHEGIKAMCLTVGEDCKESAISGLAVGRKGLSGIMFLYKIAGAMSEEKKSLYEIYCFLKALRGGSLGSLIGRAPKEAEKHNYHDYVKVLVENVLVDMFNPNVPFSMHVEKGERIAIIVNNLGGLPDLELTLIVREVFTQITNVTVNVERIYSGRFLTLPEIGFSLSILKVDDRKLKWLDYPANVMCWPNWKSSTKVIKERCYLYVDKSISKLTSDSQVEIYDKSNIGPTFTDKEAARVINVIYSIVKTVTDMTEYLNQIDATHDYGTIMKSFMNGLKSKMDSKSLTILTPYGLFNNLAELAASLMGGIAGPVYSILFSCAAQAFITSSSFSKVSWSMWMDAAKMARNGLHVYSQIEHGDRTIFDALHPFVEEFNTRTVKCLSKAVQAAMEGAEKTKVMDVPEPGAVTLAAALRVLFTELQVDLMQMELGVPSDKDCSENLVNI